MSDLPDTVPTDLLKRVLRFFLDMEGTTYIYILNDKQRPEAGFTPEDISLLKRLNAVVYEEGDLRDR